MSLTHKEHNEAEDEEGHHARFEDVGSSESDWVEWLRLLSHLLSDNLIQLVSGCIDDFTIDLHSCFIYDAKLFFLTDGLVSLSKFGEEESRAGRKQEESGAFSYHIFNFVTFNLSLGVLGFWGFGTE